MSLDKSTWFITIAKTDAYKTIKTNFKSFDLDAVLFFHYHAGSLHSYVVELLEKFVERKLK